jgi:hypothetical protein
VLVDLLADDVGVAGMVGGLLDDGEYRPPQRRRLSLRITGGSASPIPVMIVLLTSHAARYSARSVRNETCVERRPLVAAPAPTISSNHSDSTNVRCCTSPARLVPELTVVRRASASSSPSGPHGATLDDACGEPNAPPKPGQRLEPFLE